MFPLILLMLASMGSGAEHLSDCAATRPASVAPFVSTTTTGVGAQFPDVIDDIVAALISVEASACVRLIMSSPFVLPSHADLAVWAFNQIAAGRSLLGVAALLPVFEHCLRANFCSANMAPSYGIAQHGAYYSTLDG